MMTADVVLRDGSTLHLRPAEDADRAALPASFFTPLETHGAWLRALSVDAPARGLIVVGEVSGRLHVVAGYRRMGPALDRAEVAMAVASGFEGRGIGTRVLELLAEQARAEGVRVFDAWVPRGARAVVDLFASSGFDVAEHGDGNADKLDV